jgi:hypothetical protein
MNTQEIKMLMDYVKKRYNEVNLDYKTFTGDIDDELTYAEQKRITDEELNKILPMVVKKPNVDEAKHIEQEHLQKQILEFEKQAELEFNRALDKIGGQETTETIDDVYFIPKQYTKMVANGFSRGFLLYGKAGIGKTYSVMKAFKEADKQFIMLSGHITALELYHFLFEHRTENIVLDDVNILETEQNLNLLKSCLSDNSRVVSYHTSSSKLRVPNKFVFEGTIILLLNKIPKEAESLKAVESRILTYELNMDYKTKIKILFELAKQEYKDISEADRQLVVKWIKDNTSEATENLNLRLLFLCYEFFRFDKENWVKLANKTLKHNEELQLIVQGLSQNEWCDKTGLNKRTFYRYKQKIIGMPIVTK